jgi:RHS repeat-associated protein
VNDTVAARDDQTGDPRTDPDVADFTARYFAALPPTPAWETWGAQREGGALGAAEQAAASKAALHANTPTTAHLDALGRPFLTIARNRFERDGATVEEAYVTRVELDIEGNQRAVRDAVVQAGDPLGRVVMRYDYDMLGNRIHQASMEAGERWLLNDATGNTIRVFDSRGFTRQMIYDALRRPTGLRVIENGAPRLAARTVYGEGEGDAGNHRGRVFQVFDGAGVVISEAYDFKGNLLRGRRELLADYKAVVDWVNPIVPPGSEPFPSSTTYDALNRPLTITTPDGSVYRPTFNEANLLDRVEVNLEGAAAATPFVVNINYNAKGQRESIAYANGATTTYTYDPLTFRLIHLYTRRDAIFTEDCENPEPPPPLMAAPDPPSANKSCGLQNLTYTYDPAGNITHIRDDAQQTIYFRNRRVEPSADYTYDAIYRLIEATGREHLGQVGGEPSPHSHNDAPRVGLLHPGDGNAMGAYLERYVYDAVGNFLEMRHIGSDPAHPGWTRTYTYNETSLIENGAGGTLLKTSNRLTSTAVGDDHAHPAEAYRHDAHGNMTRLPHLGGAAATENLHWEFQDRLERVGLPGGETAYYVYDDAGQRARKVIEAADGMPREERLYLGGYEVYRKHKGTHAGLERRTLHVMDNQQRVALVETRKHVNDDTPEQVIRYQLSNHLGSASVELAADAALISYEEYHPYGTTAYQAVRGDVEVAAKRYRYTGMERDEESGLEYHGARYYAAWLGTWVSADPIGIRDELTLYCYAKSDPIYFSDRSGMSVFDDIGNWLTNAFNDVGNWISTTATEIGDWINTTATEIGDWISTTVTEIGDWIGSTATDLADWVGSVATEVGDWISTTATEIGDWISNTATEIGTWISTTATSVGNWLSETAAAVGSWIATAAADLWNWVLAPLIRTATNALAGFAIGFLTGGIVGGVVGGVVGGATGAVHGWAMADAHSYDWSSISGWASFLADNTWALPNSAIGSLFATANVIGGNPIDRANSRDSNALMFEGGWFSGYATTLGNVIVGTKGATPDLLGHEQAHVLQARLFGPLFYPSMIAHYAINTLIPYWWLYHNQQYPNAPITSFGEYFSRGVYPHTWAEEWGYSIGGSPQ